MMETRVLFFDDEASSPSSNREALLKAGYIVITPKSIEEAFHEINVRRAELVIHESRASKTYWDLCDQIFNQYPHFPSVHVSEPNVKENYHDKLKGSFHKKITQNSSQDFLKVVRKLVFLGRLSRENTELKKTVHLQNQIDKIFETLDLDELKVKTVEFLAKEFKAKNAYFLNAGGYGYFLQELWRVSPLSGGREAGVPMKHVLVSAEPSTETELSRYLNEVSTKLNSGWELRGSRTYLSVSENSKNSVCFIPLVGHQSKKVLGHVMLINPLLYGDAALERVFPYLGRVLGRHFDHAFNFHNAKNLTYIDDLTNLYNQRYLKLVIDKEISRSKRESTPFSVLFMDIDHFKQVNDSLGHLTGSKVLVELSKILNQHIRLTDYGFRYGGDEFILILVGTESSKAVAVAERIRKHVEASSFDVNGAQINVTLSIGIASYPDHATTHEEIIQLADRAMYAGKNKSRNVVYVAS